MSHPDHGGHGASKPSTTAHHPAPAHPITPVHRSLPHVAQPKGHFHPLPVIGHADAFYVKHIQQAEAAGDTHARDGHKVGQHVTAALDPKMPWDQKLKHFTHCLQKYCVTPPDSDESVQTFYHKLAEMVRRHAGQEALRLGRATHGEYQRRLRAGESRETIDNDAELFFLSVLGHGGRPEWCSGDAYAHLGALRDHWI